MVMLYTLPEGNFFAGSQRLWGKSLMHAISLRQLRPKADFLSEPSRSFSKACMKLDNIIHGIIIE
jgi:hypothetical protein